ncbi:MAG: exo-alpha-sialidase [Planctomycetes bacterium]|nr:exo-alpha-sialidase [Planctomycetota bacterium]
MSSRVRGRSSVSVAGRGPGELLAALLAIATAANALVAQTSAAAQSKSRLVLPPLFGDHMVLQRDRPVTVRGHAAAGARIDVTFGDCAATATAAADGVWQVELEAMPAESAGRELAVRATLDQGTDEIVLRDVVCGDVWLCAGQSNMRWRVHQAAEAEEMLEGADVPQLRLLDFEGSLYPDRTAYERDFLRQLTPANYYATTGWARSSSATARTFSAVAFAFGRRLALDLGVPIGLVHNAIGGVPIETYLPSTGDCVDPTVREVMRSWLVDPRYPAWCVERANENLAAWLRDPVGDRPGHPFTPSFLYAAGIEPMRGFPLRGVLWYQGESNATSTASGPAADKELAKAGLVSLIRSLRAAWNDPGLPFYFVQLPGIDRDWSLFRELQSEVAREVPGTGMAVTIDLGHPTDVHPRRKLPVGERLARLALAGIHGRDIEPCGPTYRDHERQGNRLRVRFDHAAGLRTVDGKPVRGFEVAGEDRVFAVAQAVIVGTDILVGSPAVAQPVAVRYAFARNPDGNLGNGALLPAAPFRTDRWRDATAARFSAACSFESEAIGELSRFEHEIGRFEAKAGHAEITAQYARTGRQCLHLFGGGDRQLNFVPKHADGSQLSFWAERWTARQPFEFRIEVRRHGNWSEVYDGGREIRVGARLLSQVNVELPAGTSAVRFRCSSPPNSGVLIDDLELAPARPIRVLDAAHASWTAPAMHGRDDNPVTKVLITTAGSSHPLAMTRVQLEIPASVRLSDIAMVQVRGGGESPFATPRPPARSMVFEGKMPLVPGDNELVIAVELAAGAALDDRVMVTCAELGFSDRSTVRPVGRPTAQRVGVAVRTAGTDGVHTYRIPGLATTNAGTLIAVYDNRYRGAGDLPGDIDIGMSRSTDGGRTWLPMRVIMDMGKDPAWSFDGIGDPAVLVDRVTGVIWVAATWSHGNRSWNGSGPGLGPQETGQLMMTRSEDDGVTWSPPINVTRQVKDPAWRFVLVGPGKGITLRDGTLVFAAQYRSADDSPFGGRPFSTLLWSGDRGDSWHIGNGVKVDTTEAQLVELAGGELMINCRDNRRGSRSVYTTRDLGKTWQVHATSRSALPEPVCMASLIRLEHEQLGPLLLFSNPASRDGRRDMSLALSRDEGRSWPMRWHTLYDQRAGFGYSCLTRIDDDHVGVLYEGTRELFFLRFSLRELLDR